jgi:hypothetical protein
MKRFWRYRYGEWGTYWYHYLIPEFGSDEFGRRTIVVHIPFAGFLVWAFQTCRCEDCEAVRQENQEGV